MTLTGNKKASRDSLGPGQHAGREHGRAGAADCRNSLLIAKSSRDAAGPVQCAAYQAVQPYYHLVETCGSAATEAGADEFPARGCAGVCRTCTSSSRATRPQSLPPARTRSTRTACRCRSSHTMRRAAPTTCSGATCGLRTTWPGGPRRSCSQIRKLCASGRKGVML